MKIIFHLVESNLPIHRVFIINLFYIYYYQLYTCHPVGASISNHNVFFQCILVQQKMATFQVSNIFHKIKYYNSFEPL